MNSCKDLHISQEVFSCPSGHHAMHSILTDRGLKDIHCISQFQHSIIIRTQFHITARLTTEETHWGV